MEQFSLEKWLKDKSRKVVTRDGREVTIEKTDIHIHGMSHMILGKYSDIYEIWHSNGRINYTGSDCNLDLFFADEKDDLTEFEQALEIMMVSFSNENFDSDVRKEMPKQKLHNCANRLLDVLRKEIDKGDWKTYLSSYKNGYEQYKQDVLKRLPKWKKCVGSTGPFIDDFRGEDYLYLNDYVIKVSELFEKLPKEEEIDE